MPDRECAGSHPRSGVSTPVYEEAKEILITKYGGACRLLLAYMDQLEQTLSIRSNVITLWRSWQTMCESRSSSYRRKEKTQSLGMELFIA